MFNRRTLAALSRGLSLFILFLGLLSGFVPQDEGSSIRRSVSTMVVRLEPDDFPSPIVSMGDGEHIWAWRADCTTLGPDENFVQESHAKQRSLQKRRSAMQPVQFSGTVIHLSMGNVSLSFGDHAETLVSVPLLNLDGISMPRLFGTQPLSYGDLLDQRGDPVRWFFETSLQAGYTPFALRRRAEKSDEVPQPVVIPKKYYVVSGKGLQRAAAFNDLIQRFSKQFGLDPTLVKAIIYSESNFNTALVSRRSAVGLMQVLPQTAAVDIHKYLYGQRGSVSFSELFDPETNIRYGTAYLHILMRRYFSGVQDPLSREYCTIAAYNMGPHRVLRLFGQTPNDAATAINALSSEDVFQMLVSRLPRLETRNYVVKVRSLKQQYAHLGASK